MRHLTVSILVTLAVLLGSAGMSWSAEQNVLLSNFEGTDTECVKRNVKIEVQKRCLQKYFFYDGQPIHPKIVKDLTTWISDGGDQVVVINIGDTQGSNRYCCDSNVEFKLKGVGNTYAKFDFKNEVDSRLLYLHDAAGGFRKIGGQGFSH